jgi:uncharacterized membrane-anchored protein
MFLMFQGTGPTSPDLGGPLLPVEPFWVGGPGFLFLLLAVAFLGIAVFLLHKSVAYQLWAANSSESPPRSGSSIAWATVLIITILWLLRWLLVEAELKGHGALIVLLRDIFAKPAEFAGLGFVASIPLASVALFNFFTSYRVALRSRTEEEARPLAASAAAAVYTAVQLAGSIASIISLALR